MSKLRKVNFGKTTSYRSNVLSHKVISVTSGGVKGGISGVVGGRLPLVGSIDGPFDVVISKCGGTDEVGLYGGMWWN